jgi:hypothetical protein
MPKALSPPPGHKSAVNKAADRATPGEPAVTPPASNLSSEVTFSESRTLLRDIYRLVFTHSGLPPEEAQIQILNWFRSGNLPFEAKAYDWIPGRKWRQPPELRRLDPNVRYGRFQWARSYVTSRDPLTRILTEYDEISASESEVLRLLSTLPALPHEPMALSARGIPSPLSAVKRLRQRRKRSQRDRVIAWLNARFNGGDIPPDVDESLLRSKMRARFEREHTRDPQLKPPSPQCITAAFNDYRSGDRPAD